MAVASVQLVICLLTVFMCKWSFLDLSLPGESVAVVNKSRVADFGADVFGKRNRSFWARHDILKMTHLW